MCPTVGIDLSSGHDTDSGCISPAVFQVTAAIAKVALKTVSGMDLPVSEFLNALKGGIGEDLADRVLDEDTLDRVVLGKETADSGMQDTSKSAYAALTKFMKENDYVDFKDEMQLVPDTVGHSGMVWVSNGNVQGWKNSRSMAPSA